MNFLCARFLGTCFALALSAALSLRAAEPPPAELIADAPFLQPASTLEFRFARPMVSRDDVGVIAKEMPVAIEPPVAGSFTWLSRSSGVFVPENAWPLSAQFSVALRPGVKAADGKGLAGDFRAKLQTPPFTHTFVRDGTGGDPGSVIAMPTAAIAFNLAVDLAGAEKLFRFSNSLGRTTAAKVRYATRRDYLELQPEQEDWQRRWELAKAGPAKPGADTAEDSDGAAEGDGSADISKLPPIRNGLVITPAEPLTVGGAWRLEMQPGLRASVGGHRLGGGALILPIGTVKPFTVTKLTPTSYINSGRSVAVEFSHEVAPDADGEAAGKFLRVEPAVPNLHFEGGGETLTLLGDFERDREYRLLIDPQLLSGMGQLITGDLTHPFRFAPIAPRLYLPQITGHQIRSGERKFEVRSVNLRALHVVARLVASADAARTLEAFKKYEREPGETNEPDEPFQPLAANLIRGKIIHDRVIELPAGALDARQQTALDWSEILGPKLAGAVFLTVEGEPLTELGGNWPAAQALVQLTDLGVLWKKTAEGLRLTVFSMADGQPAEGAHAVLLDEHFAEQRRGTADATGTALLPLDAAAAPAWLVVSQGDDAHALPLGTGGTDLPMAAFKLPLETPPWEPSTLEAAAVDLRALIFTDRPLYQPGERVRVKGVVRRVTATGLALAAGFDATLKLRGPRGDETEDFPVRTDEHGAFDTEFTLGTAVTGSHTLNVEFPGAGNTRWQRGFSCSFQVTDFQPNAFELEVAMPTRLAPQEPVRAQVGAKYFFGAPLTKATAKWSLLYSRKLFAPEGFDDWSFDAARGAAGKTLTLRGGGALDGSNGFAITPQLPAPKDAPSSGALTVEVTDLNQQTVSDTRTFTRDASDFYLGLAWPEGRVFGAGEAFAARVVAVRADGKPMPDPVEFSAELIRIRHETVRVQGAGNAISFRSEEIEEPAGKATGRTLLPVRGAGGWEVRDGVSVSFPGGPTGDYELRVSTKDGSGRPVSSALSLYVSGPDETAWDYRSAQQVDLIPDKPEYRPGDTARLLIKTPVAGEAIVTVERDQRILRTLRVRLEGNAPAIEIPLTKDDAPNVFVSLMLIRGRDASTRKFKVPEYRYGAAMLTVSDPATRLAVEVAPVRKEVQPGEEVEAEIRVRNDAGAPVADAEVTFFAVDDGVLALTGYERPMPGAIFGAPFPLAVRTGLTLFQLMSEDPAALDFENKGYLIGGGGSEGPGVKLRRDLPGTACWLPKLRTGHDGIARAKFRAPDALTRYRLVAVVHAATDAFGSGESAFAIRQPLMLLPALGQIANAGDTLVARAVVRNDTGVDGAVEVTFALDATAEPATGDAGTLRAKLDLRHGEARAVDFPVHLRAPGDAQWTWSAHLESGGQTFDDRAVSAIAVGSPAPILRETYLSDLSAGGDLLAGVNPQVLEGTGTATVTVSNTRLASLRESADRLLTYPYGCAEQTVSSLIPWLVWNDLRPVMPDLGKSDAAVRDAIDKGLDRLFTMQTEDGGIAMWPGGREPSPFISAYAALACSLLQKLPAHPGDAAGTAKVPPRVEALLKFLSERLRETEATRAEPAKSVRSGSPAEDRAAPPAHAFSAIHDEGALGECALSLWALAAAGRAEPAYHEELFRRRRELSSESRGFLALAVIEAAGPPKMVDELLSPRVPAPEAFSWFGGPARERAIQLLAWSRHEPKNAEVARLVKELLSFRANGHWGTTQGNAWALLALSRTYAATERGAKPATGGALVVRGLELPFSLSSGKPATTRAFSTSPQEPLESLAARNPAKGALFGETRWIVRPPVAAQPRQDRGYAVSRAYRKLADDGSFADATDLKVGDRVLVSLRVETPRPGHFVAIDDPLPAILEGVNPAFQSRVVAGGEGLARDWAADHREMRKDRVLYFCDHLPAGAFTFSYLARVRSAGAVTAGAPKVEEMYRPERFGLGETAKLEAK